MSESPHVTPTWTRFVTDRRRRRGGGHGVRLVGPPSQAQETTTRTVTAEKGVVQSTVSGDGSLQPATQADVNFQTSGTLENLYVSAGQQVYQGELLAELNPQQAEVGVQQANASLASAEASLQQAEDAQTAATHDNERDGGRRDGRGGHGGRHRRCLGRAGDAATRTSPAPRGPDPRPAPPAPAAERPSARRQLRPSPRP